VGLMVIYYMIDIDGGYFGDYGFSGLNDSISRAVKLLTTVWNRISTFKLT
jgi:hypothetical protein